MPAWEVDSSIMLEPVLHTSCNLISLSYASPIYWRGFLLFFEGVRAVVQPARSHWASLIGVLITSMISKLSPSNRPARAWDLFGRVSVINSCFVTGFHWMGLPALSVHGSRTLLCVSSPASLINTSS